MFRSLPLLLVGCVGDVVTPVCPAGGFLWGPTACVHPQGSSGCCAPIAPVPWEDIAANPKDKELCPESRVDQGSCFVVSEEQQLVVCVLWQGAGMGSEGSTLPLLCFAHLFFLLHLLQPAPSTRNLCSCWEAFLGKRCFCTSPRLQRGVEEHPLTQHKCAGPPGSPLLHLLGREEGGKEGAGISAPWHSCTGVSAAPRHCSSSPDGGQGPGGVSRLLLCSPELPAGCFALLLPTEWCREPRSPRYPPRWVQMTPLLTCV